MQYTHAARTADVVSTSRLTARSVVLLAALLAALMGARFSAQSQAAAATSPDEALLALLADDLAAQDRASPVAASHRGVRTYDRLLADVSPGAIAALLADNKARLASLGAITRDRLSSDNQLNFDLLRHELLDRISSASYHPEQTPITQQNGPQNSLPQLPDGLSFTTSRQLKDYIARLGAIPTYIDQMIENMRAGLAAGRTPPRVVMESVPDQALSQASPVFIKNPEKHPLYRPFLTRDADDPLARQARAVIRDEAVPAFAKLGEFLRDTYVPGCRDTIGASDGPDGLDYYTFRLRHFTTTDMTAKEIHELGKREVARIHNEMMRVIAESDFPRKDELEGDSLFQAFVHYLRTNPRFYFDDPQQLLAAYRDIGKRMDAQMPRLFGKLPRLSWGVRAMPDFIADSAPTAYYYPGSLRNGVSGTFIANTHQLNQRPKYEMIPLTLHEAVPGHHNQIALAQELQDAGLPEWRTTTGYTAFVEGWGLYSESLGLEVGGKPGGRGFYEDPYDNFGRLSYEMWRALRLVVDTGIHAFGWSRQQAIDYMLANSALTRKNVQSEVDRYIAWPGQATGYKIGELRIRRLRDLAQRSLGDRFDIRSFHDALLGAGALPLDVLETRIKAWIDAQP